MEDPRQYYSEYYIEPEEDKGRGSRPPTAAHHHLSGAVWRSSFCSGRGGRRRRRRPPRTTRRRGEEEEEGDEEEEDGHFLPTAFEWCGHFLPTFADFLAFFSARQPAAAPLGWPAGARQAGRPSPLRPARVGMMADSRDSNFQAPPTNDQPLVFLPLTSSAKYIGGVVVVGQKSVSTDTRTH